MRARSWGHDRAVHTESARPNHDAGRLWALEIDRRKLSPVAKTGGIHPQGGMPRRSAARYGAVVKRNSIPYVPSLPVHPGPIS